MTIREKNNGLTFSDDDYKKYDRIISIGDIHGCAENLEYLINAIKPTSKDLLVFLGDYLDRGPNSPGVIGYLLDLKTKIPCIFLRGNHDSMFLSFFKLGGDLGQYFLGNGGDKTLEQYGIPSIDINFSKSGKFNATLNARILSMIPALHIDFIKNTKFFLETDNIFYSHAGFDLAVMPDGKPIKYNEQSEEQYTWTRESFLNFPHTDSLDKIVIHGHTITMYRSNESLPIYDMVMKKINLDTGCFTSGVLSAYIDHPTNLEKNYFVVTNMKENSITLDGSVG